MMSNAEMMNAMSDLTYTYSDELYSDFHKEAFGFRPRGDTYALWQSMTPDQKQDAWDYMGRVCEANEREEKARQAANVARFDARIAETIALGAKDEAMAMRWIFEAESITDMDCAYGGSYICFHFDLPYDMASRFDSICHDLAETYWERMNDEI
jgi:hypothetical protein